MGLNEILPMTPCRLRLSFWSMAELCRLTDDDMHLYLDGEYSDRYLNAQHFSAGVNPVRGQGHPLLMSNEPATFYDEVSSLKHVAQTFWFDSDACICLAVNKYMVRIA
jgi:hypothetical protein